MRFGPLATREAAKNGRPMFTTFIPEADVSMLLQDRAGTVWVGTQMGLYKLNDAMAVSITFTRIEVETQVNCLTEDAAGVLCIGTYGSSADSQMDDSGNSRTATGFLRMR